MLIKARAKINWALNVLGRRPDGYHQLDMLNQRLTLADDVRLYPASSITLNMTGSARVPAGPGNLAWRAAELLKARFQVSRGVHIHLHKRIPSGAGLAGGSADAAVVLLGLNRLWCLGLSLQEMRGIGKELGADVPYCLAGGFARVGGIGEEITPLPNAPRLHLVLIQPGEELSTRKVFERLDAHVPGEPANIPGLIQALALGNPHNLYQYARNQLQPAAASLCPEVPEAVSDLKALGAAYAQMTGAGSLVYGVFQDDKMARMAQKKLSRRWQTCLMAQTVAV